MEALAQAFLDRSRRYLSREYLPKIRVCLAALTEEALWWRANPASNSVGNLMLHLAGNVRQWIVSGVGGAPDERQRQEEFDQRGPVPAAELLARLTRAVADADAVLARLTAADLSERRAIQGRDVAVLEAIYHVVEHFAMHTGQIILLTKMHAAVELRFYDVSDGVTRPRWPEADR